MRESVTSYRQQFLGLEKKAYFNYGGQGLLPRTALDAIYCCYQKVHEDGFFPSDQ